ncbi:ribosome biogenesis GTPase Der [Desulfovibrio ferrophilus]|uniref:GTPase Der n=1 Tax=Desulfovibrio ferrophilus TaxID=241368 RepID=A0A2Z6AXM5_9BACT|nr:ribosome biogenesis GTPase Der [Desulfovibrio ferrophilus]BBD07896.1 GTPase Der [Desulfovibrio ferrophilus]
MLATIALIGRPNVGKSTLFNRMIRSNKAITHDQPGVTRDRIYGLVRPRSGAQPFGLVDTGGLVPEGDGDFERDIMDQANEAMGEANAVLLVVDAREGLMPVDERVARDLRASGLPTLLVVNKVDGHEQESLTADFHALGMDMISVSASHGYGIHEMMDRVEKFLKDNSIESEEEAYDEEKQGLRIAMLGRPNAGKSSLINAVLGERRMIVSDKAGTTRDSVDVTFERQGKKYTFVDTAGVRRRTRITDSLEQFSIMKALKASQKAQVAVLVLDGTQTLSHQDKRLINFLDREKTPIIVAVNKTDLIPGRGELDKLKEHFTQELSIIKHAPVVYTSALTKAGLGGLLPLAEKIIKECSLRVGTGQLNRIMQAVIDRHQPPVVKRRRAKFYYLTQADTLPPTFVFFLNDSKLIPPSYARYLENQVRKLVGITMAPILIRFKGTHKKRTKK